ncbi:hypothetical protein BJ944DRAFT_273693 [Cunninghamella echinulata]|nr:hypothetical protein BJ944DRAFT_273693 [Cunninghamella echinulata]
MFAVPLIKSYQDVYIVLDPAHFFLFSRLCFSFIFFSYFPESYYFIIITVTIIIIYAYAVYIYIYIFLC